MSRRIKLGKKPRLGRRKRAVIRLLTLSDAATSGLVTFGNLCFPAAIGRSGVRAAKCEGDGATPRGTWTILAAYYRRDRLGRPRTRLPLTPLHQGDGWCDAPYGRNYNRLIALPYPEGHERLWRKDHLYDVIVVLDYNFSRRVRGRGSAIFMHVARRGLTPTAGCVAMKREHLLRLLAALPVNAAITVGKR